MRWQNDTVLVGPQGSGKTSLVVDFVVSPFTTYERVDGLGSDVEAVNYLI